MAKFALFADPISCLVWQKWRAETAGASAGQLIASIVLQKWQATSIHSDIAVSVGRRLLL